LIVNSCCRVSDGGMAQKGPHPMAKTYTSLHYREHHRRKTFQEEYLEFLRVNGVDYDERYLWG
jgi:hypothetical protein